MTNDTMNDPSTMHAAKIAESVRDGVIGARETVEAVLARIARVDTSVNAFTDVLPERALARADAIDTARNRGEALGPLAGVPFAVKNLIDIAGLPTRAGSKINRDLAPAERDGALVRRLEAAGAILVGGLNMGEYAYDFTGENVHDGATRNPHDLGHMSGGSSGGSGGAIGAGLVPLALGSDTNGSIRVPSAFCGCFGLKPTYGRLTRAGSFPFVGSLDHLGPMARSVTDLALSYDAMQGADPDDPVATTRAPDPAMPSLDDGIGDLRIAVAGGYFARGGDHEAFVAVETLAASLGAKRRGGDPRSRTGAGRRIPHHRRRGCGPPSRPAADPRRRFRPGRARPAHRGSDDSGSLRRARAALPPLVPRGDARPLPRGRHHPGTLDPVPGSKIGSGHLRARWGVPAGAGEYRRFHAADLVHRPARGGGAGTGR